MQVVETVPEEEAPTEEETPAEEAPAEEETPAEEEPKAEEEIPAEEEPKAEEEAPVGETPAEEETEEEVALAEDEVGVKVGGTLYTTFEEARGVAEAVDGTITYEIYGKVVFPEGCIADLGNAKNIVFAGKTEDAEIALEAESNLIGLDVTGVESIIFNHLILSRSNGKYAVDSAEMNQYFCAALRNAGTNGVVTYNSCVFPNGSTTNTYGKTYYNNCKFTEETSGRYNLWVKGSDTYVTGCEFTRRSRRKALHHGYVFSHHNHYRYDFRRSYREAGYRFQSARYNRCNRYDLHRLRKGRTHER